MASNTEHLEHELAGLASRIETMERDWKRENRSNSGLILPAGMSKTTADDMRIGALVRQMEAVQERFDQVLEALKQVEVVQRRQQDAIEEMAILGTYTPAT